MVELFPYFEKCLLNPWIMTKSIPCTEFGNYDLHFFSSNSVIVAIYGSNICSLHVDAYEEFSLYSLDFFYLPSRGLFNPLCHIHVHRRSALDVA